MAGLAVKFPPLSLTLNVKYNIEYIIKKAWKQKQQHRNGGKTKKSCFLFLLALMTGYGYTT